MLNIVLLGPPGSGKGTQAERIVQQYGLTHISTGACLRQEISAKTEIGRKVEAIIASGNYVSDAIIYKIIENYERSHNNLNGYLFDGFPRTLAQAEFLDTSLGRQDLRVSAAIDLEVESNELIRRILYRGTLSGRSDDNEITARKRIEVYQEKTSVLIEYYKDKGVLHEIDGIHTVDETWNNVRMILEHIKH